MKLLLTADNSFMSHMVRLFTFSRWSHVAILDGIDVIEATPSGVRVSDIDTAILNASDYAVLKIPVENEELFLEAVRSQIGKPYDYAAIFGIVLRENWQDDSKWFCAELPAWAAEQAGTPIFRSEGIHRITPEHWWTLAPKERV